MITIVAAGSVFDDVDQDDEEARAEQNADGGNKKPVNPRWMTKEKFEQKKMNAAKNTQEMKTLSEIKKKRDADAKNKVKNMKKSERATYVKKMKEKSKEEGLKLSKNGGKGDHRGKDNPFAGQKGAKPKGKGKGGGRQLKLKKGSK